MKIDDSSPITPENILFIYDEKRQAIVAAAEPLSPGGDYRLLGQLARESAQSEEIQLLFFEHLVGICRGERHTTEIRMLRGDRDRAMILLPQEVSV
jgi:hypothetical protein